MDVIVEDYTPKSIIVYGGGTREIKEQLKKLGGRWKKLRLRETPKFAWILPKAARPSVEALIGKPLKPPPSPVQIIRLKPKPSKPSTQVVRKCIRQTSQITGYPENEVEEVVFEEYPQYRPKGLLLGKPSAKPVKKPPVKKPKSEAEAMKTLMKINPYEVPSLCNSSSIFKKLCAQESTWKKLVDRLPETRKPGETWKSAFRRILGLGVSKHYQAKDYWNPARTKASLEKLDRGIKGFFLYQGMMSYQNPGNLDLEQYFMFDSKTGEFVIPEGVVTLRLSNFFHTIFNFKGEIRLICPDSLEILMVRDVPLAGIQVSRKLFFLKVEDGHLASLDLSKTSIKYLRVFNTQLEELILPSSGLKRLDVPDNRLRVLFVPPGVTLLACRNTVFAKVYLKRNKQNRGDEKKPSKQEKALARCTGGEEAIQVRKARKIYEYKTIYRYTFKNFVWYDKFPSPGEQRAIYAKYRAPSVGMLDVMPTDAILEIMLKLPYKEIMKLCKSSPRLFRLCKDDDVWRTIVQRDLNLSKPVKYYGYDTYFALYRDLHKPGREWKTLGNVSYLGPDATGEKFDERVPILPKGTIAFSAYDVRFKLVDPESVRYIRDLPYLNMEELKMVMKTNLRYVGMREVETLADKEKDRPKIIKLYSEKAGRTLEMGKDIRKDDRWQYSGPPGPTTLDVYPSVLWPGVKWMHN